MAIQQTIEHEEHLWWSFWSVAVFETASEALAPYHNNRNWLKQLQSHFHRAIPHKIYYFLLFWWLLSTATPGTWSSSRNINNTPCVSRLSFRFLWLWVNKGSLTTTPQNNKPSNSSLTNHNFSTGTSERYYWLQDWR